MSNLSGYDGDVIGFDSVSQNRRAEMSSSTQTSEFAETGVATQTMMSKECGSMASAEELNAQDDILKEYPPPGLNEFLRKVVPAMLDQLDQNDKEMTYNSSDSDEEEVISAKLFQEIAVKSDIGSGDQASSILAVSWSSAGNSIAVSIGKMHHEEWCTHDGLIKVYTVKRTSGDKFVHAFDITEKNCVTVLEYHPSVAALLAYGTTSGEVVLCNIRNAGTKEDMQLTSPAGCHGSKRVSSLKWADASLANSYLIMQINKTGKRRGASDQILISSGSDGSINVWQVNANLKIFECVISYCVNGSRKMAACDISCFDFIKTCPLRPTDEKAPDDIFAVGTVSGKLLLCKTTTYQPIVDCNAVDPVYEVLEGHSTCVLDLAFSFQKPGIFVSMSMYSELRVYDVNQCAPIKVIFLDVSVSCISWLPNNPSVVILGLSRCEKDLLRVYNVSSARHVSVEGLTGHCGASVTAVAVNQSGLCRIVAGDSGGTIRVWELPARRIRLMPEDLTF